VVTQNGQSIEIGNACHTRQTIKTKQKQSKKRTQCALHTTIRKQTQITLIRHEPSYKQHGEKERINHRLHAEITTRTQNVKTHNRRTQNTKKMSNTDLNDR
jgi:hypothetical protein